MNLDGDAAQQGEKLRLCLKDAVERLTAEDDPNPEVAWRAWRQVWGSTCGGKAGVGGQAMTSAQTLVVSHVVTGKSVVYHGWRHVATLWPNVLFWSRAREENLPGEWERAEWAKLRRVPEGGAVHELKCWPQYYEALVCPERQRRKSVEVRKDDRGYQVGDVLVLLEWDSERASPEREVVFSTEKNGGYEVRLSCGHYRWVPESGEKFRCSACTGGSMREGYTGRRCERVVTHILRDAPFAPEGYAVMSIMDAEGR